MKLAKFVEGYGLILETDEEGRKLAELIRKHKNRKLTKKDLEILEIARKFKEAGL